MREEIGVEGTNGEDNGWRGSINGGKRIYIYIYIGRLVWVETVKYLRKIYKRVDNVLSAFWNNSNVEMFSTRQDLKYLIDVEIVLQGMAMKFFFLSMVLRLTLKYSWKCIWNFLLVEKKKRKTAYKWGTGKE